MRIAIDCRSLRKQPAGVPNFLISVINTLARRGHTLYLLSNEPFHCNNQKRIPTSVTVQIIVEPLPFLKRTAIIWYLLKLSGMVKSISPDYFFTPIPNLPFWLPSNIKTLVTVHDMVYKRFPSTMSTGNWLINFLLHDRSIRKADRLWAVSNYTKTELNRFFPDRRCASIFVGAAIDKNAFYQVNVSDSDQNRMASTYNMGNKFLLFVGTLEPRKNLSFLISLMPLLAKDGYCLLIVGARGWGNSDLHPANSNSIKFTGFISTEELIKLYSLARVYVSTALNEGFGLPQLEAMRCGCPVVSPRNSAMTEVVDGAGETVEGWNRQDWIDTIQRVDANREFYTARGLARAKTYDWETVIAQLEDSLL